MAMPTGPSSPSAISRARDSSLGPTRRIRPAPYSATSTIPPGISRTPSGSRRPETLKVTAPAALMARTEPERLLLNATPPLVTSSMVGAIESPRVGSGSAAPVPDVDRHHAAAGGDQHDLAAFAAHHAETARQDVSAIAAGSGADAARRVQAGGSSAISGIGAPGRDTSVVRWHSPAQGSQELHNGRAR